MLEPQGDALAAGADQHERVLGAAAARRHQAALIIDDPITISNAKVMADAVMERLKK